MADRVRILVDVHEQRSGIPGLLEQLGADLELLSLPAGDYALGDDTLVERKAVLDLHSAVRRGHLWSQLAKLKAGCSFPYLLVEGRDLDAGGRGLHPNAIRGACLELDSFAVQLARVTMWMGHKLAVDELDLEERVLPLVDLSGIRRGNALKLEWPRADAIIGNPPYHGSQRLRGELGDDYVEWLKSEFGIGVKTPGHRGFVFPPREALALRAESGRYSEVVRLYECLRL